MSTPSTPAHQTTTKATSPLRTAPIEVLMPAHNEVPAIGRTIREFHDFASTRLGIPVRFLVAEDGSTDDTIDVM